MRRPSRPIVLSLALGLFAWAFPAAADDAAATKKEGGSARIAGPLRDGTVAWYALIALSFGATFAALELAVQLRRARFVPEVLVTDLEAEARAGRREELRRVAQAAVGEALLARVVLGGLDRSRLADSTQADVRAAAEAEGESEFGRLDRRVALLSSLGLAAPLLGLLGTVQALMSGCQALAAGDAARPADLVELVGRSLGPTAWGLATALLLCGIVAFLRHRLDTLAGDVGIRAESILWPTAGRTR